MGADTKVTTISEGRVLSVSELNRKVRQTVESGFGTLWVAGEITGFTEASSGHWYFSLKDKDAQVRCAMFRNRNYAIRWRPKNGDAVEVLARPSIYEARGEFQLSIEDMRVSGLGNLFEAFQKLKAKLDAEGLFDPTRKRPLPSYPKRIAVVTSPGAAALRDIVTTFARRAPHVSLRLYPSLVQGQEAPEALINALKKAQSEAWADLILLCRGGGSMEDLWAFNDEALARTISSSSLPIISGVGHETDFTIADFAADLRAPTPTAAAELAAPARTDLMHALAQNFRHLSRALHLSLERAERQVSDAQRTLYHRLERGLQDRWLGLDRLKARLIHPREALSRKRAELNHLEMRLRAHHPNTALQSRRELVSTLRMTMRNQLTLKLRDEAHRLDACIRALALLNPESVLERGYSLVFKADGVLVKDSQDVSLEDSLRVRLARGELWVKKER